jgi:hypothetical protein
MINESKLQKAKRIKSEKKELNIEQKKLKRELDQGKKGRINARRVQATTRKRIRAIKLELSSLTSKTGKLLVERSTTKLDDLADDILEEATELCAALRRFKKAQEILDK